jgi:hypothetical protein
MVVHECGFFSARPPRHVLHAENHPAALTSSWSSCFPAEGGADQEGSCLLPVLMGVALLSNGRRPDSAEANAMGAVWCAFLTVGPLPSHTPPAWSGLQKRPLVRLN